jgi:sodium/potassium-transporting ATPase subunit alpha
VDQVYDRLGTSEQGLNDEAAKQRLKDYGRNVFSAPPSRWLIKTVSYLFGDFGSILFIASILVFVSWKPLGQPPQLANLALGIVLAIVWVLQALFSFFQGSLPLERLRFRVTDSRRLVQLQSHGIDQEYAS